MKPPIDWLLEGEDWLVFLTRSKLLQEAPSNPAMINARKGMIADPRVKAIINNLQDWPGKVISSHKSAGQSFHQLNFLADIGVRASDEGMANIIDKILANQSEEGPFTIAMNVPTHFGGSGKDEGAWALCDTPLLTYALQKLGLDERPEVQRALQYLVELTRSNGWPCAVSPQLGKFRGPGRKEDPCPDATLGMLKAIGASPDVRFEQEARVGTDSLLNCWAERESFHPYLFYMGTDFCKLKLPFIWYDIVHILDVLTQFIWTIDDPRLLSMLEILESKMDDEGKFTPESVWTFWSDWEFGQKKLPSRWLTLSAWLIMDRVKPIH